MARRAMKIQFDVGHLKLCGNRLCMTDFIDEVRKFCNFAHGSEAKKQLFLFAPLFPSELLVNSCWILWSLKATD